MNSLKFKVKSGRNPDGIRQIINLSKQKGRRTKDLMNRYKEIGFIDYSLIDLAEMSLTQWRRRDYAVPEGYALCRRKILRKITDQSESLRKKYFTPRY